MENLDSIKEKVYNSFLICNDAAQIARENKLTYNWVVKILRELGVKNPVRLMSEKEKEYIIEKYKSGISTVKLSKELNRSTETICSFLRKTNNIRTVSESLRQFNLNQSFFEKIDTEQKAYWLGFIYADGFIVDDYTFGICLKHDDLSHLEKFKNDIEFTGTIKEKQQGKINTARIHITCKKTVSDMNKLGVVKQKTFIVKFPTFEQVPENLMNHFLRGYFDGDGYISKDCKALEIIGTEHFAFGFSEVVFSEIQLPISYVGNRNGKFRNGIVSFQYNGKNRIEKLYNYLYKDATVFLDRKRNRFLNIFENQI